MYISRLLKPLGIRVTRLAYGMEKALDSLPVDGFSIEIKRVVKSGLDVCDFNVVLDKAHENHDHDMEYLHGKEAPPAFPTCFLHNRKTDILLLL